MNHRQLVNTHLKLVNTSMGMPPDDLTAWSIRGWSLENLAVSSGILSLSLVHCKGMGGGRNKYRKYKIQLQQKAHW